MAVEVERLVATLEARLDKYEKSLNKAHGITKRQFTRIEKRGAKMQKKLSALGVGSFRGLIGGATAALAPILGITAALNGARDALSSFDSIAKTADKIGLTTDELQEFRHAADLSGVSTNTLDMAMQRFSRRVGEAVQGKGELLGILKQYNIAVTDSAGRTRRQVDILADLAEVVKGAGSEQEKLRISFKAFDSEGAALVNLLKGGADGMAAVRREARSLGIVIDEHLLRRAEELNDELSIAARVADVQFKQALIDLAPVLISSATLAGDLAGGIRRIVDAFRALDAQSSSSLEERLRSLSIDDLDAENRILLLKNQQNKNDGIFGALKNPIIGHEIADLEKQRAELQQEQVKILAILDGRKPIIIPAPGGGGPPADDAIKQAEAVKKLIATLEFERTLIGLTEVEQAKMNAVRRAGAAATETQREYIEQLVESTYNETKSVNELADAMAEYGDIGRDAVRGFADAFADGKIEASEFSDILKDVGSRLLDMALNSVFSTSGFNPLGALFGGRRAQGGPIVPGRGYLVGERGPELVVPQEASRVIPTSQLNGGGGVTVAPSFHIDARGSQMGEGQMRSIMSDVSNQLKRELPGMISNATLRRKLR